jgi:hypothetical protein
VPRARLQSQLLHLRADLVHIAAEEARGLCNRLAVVEFVLEVTDVGLRPGLKCVNKGPGRRLARPGLFLAKCRPT